MASLRPSTLLALLAATACVPDFDLDLSQVTAPRVVAIQSTPGEAGERDPVAVSALVVAPDPDAVPAPEWALCLERKPLVELGPISPLCLDRGRLGSESLLPLGTGARIDTTVPQQACRQFGPNRPEPKQGEPPGRPVDPDFTGGSRPVRSVSMAGSPPPPQRSRSTTGTATEGTRTRCSTRSS
jgi:hypothetical protein